MKETTNYPIYLFEEPVLIPKIQEETKDILMEIDFFMKDNISQRKIKTKTFNLLVEFFQIVIEFKLVVNLKFYIVEENKIISEIVFEDVESEFVKQLKRYNQILRENGRAEFQCLLKLLEIEEIYQ